VTTRANQSSLTFEVSADAAAQHQFATLAASVGDTRVQGTIEVNPAAHPILTIPEVPMAEPGKPVRFTVAAESPTNQPVELTATGAPAGATFDNSSGQFEWVPVQTGRYPINFTAVGADGGASSATVTLNVGSGIPMLESIDRSCTPGGIASVKGNWLSDSEKSFMAPAGDSMSLDGAKVLLNNQYVPVIEASPSGIQFLCPSVQPGTPLKLAVQTSAGVSSTVNTAMQSSAPWILTVDRPRTGQGQVTFAGSADLATARNAFVPGHPAQTGDEVIVWASGLGDLSAILAGKVSVVVGGTSAALQSVNPVAGRAGLYAIAVTIPEDAANGDAVPVQLQVADLNGKLESSNTVTIATEPGGGK
jgi:uncharacterized protein (TIGR03437 family)